MAAYSAFFSAASFSLSTWPSKDNPADWLPRVASQHFFVTVRFAASAQHQVALASELSCNSLQRNLASVVQFKQA